MYWIQISSFFIAAWNQKLTKVCLSDRLCRIVCGIAGMSGSWMDGVKSLNVVLCLSHPRRLLSRLFPGEDFTGSSYMYTVYTLPNTSVVLQLKNLKNKLRAFPKLTGFFVVCSCGWPEPKPRSRNSRINIISQKQNFFLVNLPSLDDIFPLEIFPSGWISISIPLIICRRMKEYFPLEISSFRYSFGGHIQWLLFIQK